MKAYFLLANGFEEIEAIAPIDILRRCGVKVKTVSVHQSKIVSGSHGIDFESDEILSKVDLNDGDMIVLPGGGFGVENLDKVSQLTDIIKSYLDNDKYVAAICAAPSLLGKRGFLKGKKATCYPGFEKFLDGAILTTETLIKDGNIITAKAAGVALDFGFLLGSLLAGQKTSDLVRKGIFYDSESE